MSRTNQNINHPRVCLLGASFSVGNQGVSALAAGSIQCILHSFTNAGIFFLDYGEESIKYRFGEKSIELINIRFSKKFFLRNNIAMLIAISLLIRIIPFKKIRRKLISNNICLNNIHNSDVVLSIAGGDSFSDIYGMARFFYVSLPQILALFLGKKLVLLPQTLGPFNSYISKAVTRFILNRASLIYSRDYTSLNDIKASIKPRNFSDKARFCYDVGFIVEPTKPDNQEVENVFRNKNDTGVLIGINVSGLLFMGGYTKNNMFGLKIDYREFIYNLIHYFIETKNSSVLLVPHVFGLSEKSESDYVVCRKIYLELKDKFNDKILFIEGDYNQNEIKYIIGLCDFFIGSRMHACIAALSQHIPTVAIAYSKKFYGVMQTIGLESIVTDPRYLNETEIMSMVNDIYEKRVQLREMLNEKMPHVRQTVLNLFHDISMDLKIN